MRCGDVAGPRGEHKDRRAEGGGFFYLIDTRFRRDGRHYL